MNRSRIIVSCTIASFVFMIGCSGNPAGVNSRREVPSLATSYEEASAEQIAKETAELCQVFDVQAGSLGKTATASSSDPELSLNGQAWTYADGWWSRNGEFSLTGAQGEDLMLSGYDSARFKNADGTTIHYPIIENATSVTLIHKGSVHIRNHQGGYVEMERTYTLDGTVSRGATDTTLVLDGALSQYFKAENANNTAWCDYEGTAQVDTVTYIKTTDGWSKPVSGSIHAESPYRDISITFFDGIAQITVSDKDGQVLLSTSVIL